MKMKYFSNGYCLFGNDKVNMECLKVNIDSYVKINKFCGIEFSA